MSGAGAMAMDPRRWGSAPAAAAGASGSPPRRPAPCNGRRAVLRIGTSQAPDLSVNPNRGPNFSQNNPRRDRRPSRTSGACTAHRNKQAHPFARRLTARAGVGQIHDANIENRNQSI
jgi:hypothetical protein